MDDGSIDHPETIVQTFDDARFRIIRLNSNQGRAVARQVALDAATGEYLAKLDADDWLFPEKLRMPDDDYAAAARSCAGQYGNCH